MRLLIFSAACFLPFALKAHDSFLTPHLHAGHVHGYGPEHGHEVHKEHYADGKKAVTEPSHEGHAESRFHISTGVRYTEYEVDGQDAHLLETGLGIVFDAMAWLRLSAEGRYGWFDGDFAREDGWLPPRAGIELHFPVADHWEIGVGLKTQFPGDDPLAADEWELVPEVEVRYDRGGWYMTAIGEMSWIAGGSSHEHGAEENDAGEGHDEEDEEHGGEEEHHADDGHGEEEHAEVGVTHAHASSAHVDIHEIIEPHADVEFSWRTAFGVRVFEERLTLEGRLSGTHVVQGESESRHYIRAGAQAIFQVTKNTAVLLDGSLPVTNARRNEWQTSLAVRVSFEGNAGRPASPHRVFVGHPIPLIPSIAAKKGRRSGATSAVAFPERPQRMPHLCRPNGVPRSP